MIAVLVLLLVNLILTPSVVLARSQTELTVASEILAEERSVTVSLPDSYALQNEHAYPVLYLLDGENNLDYTASVADFSADNGLIPELIVVALHAGTSRARDYLPENDQEHQSGRASRFLAHLRDELIPEIEKRYRAAPLRLLSGHSYGGVFVLHTLAAEPELFRAYLAQSPYLDPTIGPGIVSKLEDSLSKGSNAARVLHLVLGQEPQLQPAFDRLTSWLGEASPDGLRWGQLRLEGESHMTTRLRGAYEAHEFVFPTWSLEQGKLLQEGVPAINSHLETLSENYGYPVLPAQAQLAGWTQVLIAVGKTGAAHDMARRHRDYYPESPLAHFMLAQAAGADGRKELVQPALRRALELHEMHPSPKLEPIMSKLGSR